MNSFTSRLNSLFAFTLSVMAALTFGCFLSTFFNDHLRPVEINVGKVSVKNVPDYSANREKSDLGYITFDLFSDLSPIFNWNVKQLFLYLTAEYETEDHTLNQVVLWDKIVERGDNTIIDLRNANTKYYFWDFGNGLKGNENVTLTLSWNVIPNAGTLPKVTGSGKNKIVFPDQYTAGQRKIGAQHEERVKAFVVRPLKCQPHMAPRGKCYLAEKSLKDKRDSKEMHVLP